MLKCRQAVKKQRGQHTTQPIAMPASLRPCTARLQAGVPTHPQRPHASGTHPSCTHMRGPAQSRQKRKLHTKRKQAQQHSHMLQAHIMVKWGIYDAICGCYVPTPSWLRQGHDAGRLGACYWAANAPSKCHSKCQSNTTYCQVSSGSSCRTSQQAEATAQGRCTHPMPR